MSSSQVPLWRRPQPAGETPSVPQGDQAPSNNRFYNRGGRGGRGNRGGRGGRGSRGGFGNQYVPNQQYQSPQIDDADLYYLRDIEHHFGGQDERGGVGHNKSTFHDSKVHPDQLSYMLLFGGANPRWAGDRIVFAKSKLNLLPEYREKKAEHGEWVCPQSTEPAESAEESQESNTPKAIQTSQPTQDPTDTITSAETTEPTEPTEKAEDTTPSPAIIDTSPAVDEEKSKIDSAPDTNKGDEAPAPTTAPPASSSSRMKYSDVRMLPPEEQEQYARREVEKREVEEPSFPAIPPIDYVPSKHPYIAVFEEHRAPGSGIRRPGPNASRFTFIGWFKISRVNILAPESAELVRMQQQKWVRRDRFGKVLPTRTRDAAAWKSALAVEWAVVKFESPGEGEEAPPPPIIEKLPEPERPARVVEGEGEGEIKGVNELLSEMRFGGEGQAPNGKGEAPEEEVKADVVGAQGQENAPSA
ncbi:hypothetical protein F5B20DRAFT_551559 [Whalleya microplaca]|nr:hypothetical protein F5B20DRAFT_551559 [Whalleya microplaca]